MHAVCSTGATQRRSKAPATRGLRLPALAIATLFALCGIAAVVFAYRRVIAPDFLSFWAAGVLALHGQAASAYDIALHHAVEVRAIPSVGLLPFPYPPPVLALFVPFALLPYWIAFVLWTGVTAAIYVRASRKWVEARFSLAQGAAAANFIVGQNGFLTSGVFIAGTGLLRSRPFLAGAVLGLLCVKPQLAALLPVALIAGREWRAIAGGIASAVALNALGLLLFGVHAYASFLTILPNFSHWLSAGRWPWGELASSFALLRWFGVPNSVAMAIHGAVAICAAIVTARAWALKLDQRIAILAAATLLVSPYLFTYDALLLTVPLGALARQNRRAPVTAIWLLSLLPAIAYVTPFPNATPIAAFLAIVALHRKTSETRADQPQTTPATG